jgi:hypothetical protein
MVQGYLVLYKLYNLLLMIITIEIQQAGSSRIMDSITVASSQIVGHTKLGS